MKDDKFLCVQDREPAEGHKKDVKRHRSLEYNSPVTGGILSVLMLIFRMDLVNQLL